MLTTRVGGASRLTQKPLFIVEGHASRNLYRWLWLSADAYTKSAARPASMPSATTTPPTRSGSDLGMGVTAWPGGDVILNYDRVFAKPTGRPDAQAIPMTVRQVW